jgi:hypothetical protein
MTVSETSDVKANRLSSAEYVDNFSDLHPPLDDHEAHVEADRCYFCYDAPCMTACPTSIDIPLFIREDRRRTTRIGAAKTIFDQNIFGGMCARVCPTETLCEEVCVRETAEGKPVKIGLLQRYATDAAMASRASSSTSAQPSTGKRAAVIGAGPAGLACAHRLSPCTVMMSMSTRRARKAGGLNEFGIAAYKAPGGFAQIGGRLTSPSIGGIDGHITARRSVTSIFGWKNSRATTTPSSSVRVLRASMRWAKPTRMPKAASMPSPGSASCARHPTDLGSIPVGAQRRRDRRRHDGGRRRRAGKGAWRRRGDDLLSRTEGTHEGVRIRAGNRPGARRFHPLQHEAEEACSTRQWRGDRHGVRPQRRDGRRSPATR